MKFWYSRSLIVWLLLPLSALFWLISSIRRGLYRLGILSSYKAKVPVIIVGNISVGGNGKTPVVIWLAQQLEKCGVKVGIISRGYGSQADRYPMLVYPTSDVVKSGDEPLLIAKKTHLPVCISPNRQESIELLQQNFEIDVIISDDGLQHYQLQRDVEIVVMDSVRGLGNGLVLPAGPLREFAVRLQEADLVIAHGEENQYSQAVMELIPSYAVNLQTNEKKALSEFKQVTAIAGIGHPQRFFDMLTQLNLQVLESRAFADHQAFDEDSLNVILRKELPLLMTEKDAVKCRLFARENWWYVPVETKITGDKMEKLLKNLVEKIKDGS